MEVQIIVQDKILQHIKNPEQIQLYYENIFSSVIAYSHEQNHAYIMIPFILGPEKDQGIIISDPTSDQFRTITNMDNKLKYLKHPRNYLGVYFNSDKQQYRVSQTNNNWVSLQPTHLVTKNNFADYIATFNDLTAIALANLKGIEWDELLRIDDFALDLLEKNVDAYFNEAYKNPVEHKF